ncbi:addiction module toxin RelE [Bacteroides sp. MSB163]|uniref:addiction module toxin RelE n=1 Tax=Bacteroides maternus TaxID=3117552 RepID=UPI002ED88F4F
MNYDIIVQPTFQHEVKRLAKHYASFKEDYVALIDALEQNPLLGTDLDNRPRKIRVKTTSKGKGKSGGTRVITFIAVTSERNSTMNLLFVYDKAERSSISKKELAELLKKNGLM